MLKKWLMGLMLLLAGAAQAALVLFIATGNVPAGKFHQLAEIARPHGLTVEVRFLGSHDRVIRAVLAGEVDGGASYTDAWDGAAKVLDLSPLQILAQTEEIPKDALAVRRDAPEETVQVLQKALLALGPQDPRAGRALKDLGIDGFVPGEDRLYDVLRAAREAERQMGRRGRG